ncbi:alpha/beta hydrolase [Paenibacillus turpanensis]|uniref:alpha/beta hydrolase n=1 Tax=Paenibacillus turpanensis TaxID=2689078 RepID=UPI001409A022|nr:alpha/beta hydrolase [Paenibacillus turpanensis]
MTIPQEAKAGPGQRIRKKVEISRSEQWEMVSRAEGRTYQIFVAKPMAPMPPSGYPVLYLLDANSVFGTMTEAIRLQCRRPDKTGVTPAVIVGIGYPTEEPFSPNRFYDFTPAPSTEYTRTPGGAPLPEQGGAAAFLQFIEEELKPEIEREFTIDKNRQSIFGHSLGGLFVLYTLFSKPDAFQSYIAGSPSLHWNKQLMLDAEREFTARLGQGAAHQKVLIAMGGLEASHVSGNYMLAKELSERLACCPNEGLKAEFIDFAGEGHVSVLPLLINRTLRFSFAPESEQQS